MLISSCVSSFSSCLRTEGLALLFFVTCSCTVPMLFVVTGVDACRISFAGGVAGGFLTVAGGCLPSCVSVSGPVSRSI